MYAKQIRGRKTIFYLHFNSIAHIDLFAVKSNLNKALMGWPAFKNLEKFHNSKY